MRARIVIAVACVATVLASCRESWPPDIVARWSTGDFGLTAIELHLAEDLDTTQSGNELVRRYREAAEELCVRDHLMRASAADPDIPLSPIDRELARRQIAVNAWIQDRIKPQAEVTPREIQSFYDENPEFSHRPERRMVEHIYRRTGGSTGEESAREVLAEVRARFLAGDSFHTLAVEYSQSETGAFGGSLGLVSQGDLDRTAEDAVFSLEVGEISQPIPVHGGLAVFVVTQIYKAKDFPLSDVRDQIEHHLQQGKLTQRVEALLEKAVLPGGSYAVEESRFHETLESDDPHTVLYSDAGLAVSLDDWRERLVGGTAATQLTQYTDLLRLQRLYHLVVNDGFLDHAGQLEAVNARLESTLNDRIVNRTVSKLLTQRAGRELSALRAWYEQNRERYQSPIELLVNVVVVEPTTEVEPLAASLRAIASQYVGGDLEPPAASVPGATVSRAWVGLVALDAYHPRVKASLLTLQPPACAPLCNVGGYLHLFCLEDRKDPRQLSFDEARERVMIDYVASNQQELYSEMKSEILENEGFEFNESRVREILHAPAKADE